jgi:hypothetical protein
LAHTIYNAPIQNADFAKRTKLNVAAVLVNNFTNHIFALAEDYCKKEGIEFKELLPLIQDTINRIGNEPLSLAQTGPAAQKDFETIAKQEELLQNYPKLLKLYRFFTESILQE